MHRNAAYRLALALLLAGMLTVILHPIHATPIIRTHETPADDEPCHRQPGLTSHTPEWNKTYGGTSWDEARSVVETGDGGYAIAGETWSFGAGSRDFWLVKTDASGSVEWNQTYGGTNDDRAFSMVETGDGGYALTGPTYSFGAGGSDFWLVKTDAYGNMEWNQTYGGADYDAAWSMVETGDGGYAIAGWTGSFGAGNGDFWLIKTDSTGNMEWNKTYGGIGSDYACCVVETGDGGYALAGSTNSSGAGLADFWLVKTDIDGNMEWNKTYGGTNWDHGYSVVETGDGGYALTGPTYSFGAGIDDFWLIKTDSTGNMEWNKTYGGIGLDHACCVVETGDGGYAIAGGTGISPAGSYDFWLVKTDASGNMQWNQTYGGTSHDVAWSLVETCDGGYTLAGYTQSFGAGSADFWLVKTEGREPEETMVFFNVNPNPAVVGDTFTLEGILVDASSQPLANETVRLYARPLAGFWRYITGFSTNSYGIFTWQVTIPEVPAGAYVFAVYYPGSERYESCYNFATLVIQQPTTPRHDTTVNGEDFLRPGSISQAPEWNQTYGGPNQDYAYSVVQTGDGGYTLAGYTLSFGSGPVNSWLVKTDAGGNALWNQTYGGPYYSYAYSVVETTDGGYAIAGDIYSYGAGKYDCWLVKTDSAGHMEWNQTYGGTDSDSAYSVIETSGGGYAIAGRTLSFGAGGQDFWLVKTDSAGNALWNQTYGGSDSDSARSVVQTADGGYALAGWTYSSGAGEDDFWLVKTDSAGNALWNQTYGGPDSDYGESLVETGDGGYAMAGYTRSFGAGIQDFWLVKTDASGNALWNQTYGGKSTDVAYSLVETTDGGYAIAGYTYGAGSADFWLVKTDAAGNMEWNQTYGGTSWDEALCVIQTGTGGYALAGRTESYGAGSSDFWLVKTEGQAPEETMVFFNVHPNPASVGDTLTLQGILVDASSQPLANETVQLYARPLAGSWRYITAFSTDSHGLFTWQATIPAVPTGAYVFAIYYPGSESYESCYNFATLIIQ